jgi:hypothetical protein
MIKFQLNQLTGCLGIQSQGSDNDHYHMLWSKRPVTEHIRKTLMLELRSFETVLSLWDYSYVTMSADSQSNNIVRSTECLYVRVETERYIFAFQCTRSRRRV